MRAQRVLSYHLIQVSWVSLTQQPGEGLFRKQGRIQSERGGGFIAHSLSYIRIMEEVNFGGGGGIVIPQKTEFRIWVEIGPGADSEPTFFKPGSGSDQNTRIRIRIRNPWMELTEA